MNRLLRGIIDFGDGRLSRENAEINYARLSAAKKLNWVQPDQEKIIIFVRMYLAENLELPDHKTVRDYFDKCNEFTVTEMLKDVRAAELYTHSNYGNLLKSILEEQSVNRLRQITEKASVIAHKGLEVGVGRKKRTLRGVRDAVQYITNETDELIEPEGEAAQELIELRERAGKAWDRYLDAKANPQRAYGVFMGIDPVDKVCGGAKPGELWIHAASFGELKSMLAFNWAYNAVTRYRRNVLYVSLEMSHEQVERRINAIHTANGKFRAQGRVPLNHQLITDGELDAEGEAFYREASSDFETNPEYCRFFVWSPHRDVTINDIRREAEKLDREHEIGLIIIDHSELVHLPGQDPYLIRLNALFRRTKLMARQFAGGRQVPIVMLHQINRQGKKDASKTKKYSAEALSWAHEAERSADVLTTTFLDEGLRAAGEVLIDCLKHRSGALFSQQRLSWLPGCGRIFWDSLQGSVQGSGVLLDDYESTVRGH